MVLLLHGGRVDQVLGGVHLGVHIRQLELGVLELADGLAELDALLGVLDGLVQAPSARPRAWAAMPIRPPSRVSMAILKPLPSWPSRFSLGTTQSSKIRSQVARRGYPSSSRLPMEKPGKSFSTMKAEMPWLPLCFRSWRRRRRCRPRCRW